MELVEKNLSYVGNADVDTENARYEVKYTVLEKDEEIKLCTMSAEVYAKTIVVETPAVEATEDTPAVEGVSRTIEDAKGTISMNFGQITTDKFPYNENFKIYVEEFSGIVELIKNKYNILN